MSAEPETLLRAAARRAARLARRAPQQGASREARRRRWCDAAYENSRAAGSWRRQHRQDHRDRAADRQARPPSPGSIRWNLKRAQAVLKADAPHLIKLAAEWPEVSPDSSSARLVWRAGKKTHSLQAYQQRGRGRLTLALWGRCVEQQAMLTARRALLDTAVHGAQRLLISLDVSAISDGWFKVARAGAVQLPALCIEADAPAARRRLMAEYTPISVPPGTERERFCRCCCLLMSRLNKCVRMQRGELYAFVGRDAIAVGIVLTLPAEQNSVELKAVAVHTTQQNRGIGRAHARSCDRRAIAAACGVSSARRTPDRTARLLSEGRLSLAAHRARFRRRAAIPPSWKTVPDSPARYGVDGPEPQIFVRLDHRATRRRRLDRPPCALIQKSRSMSASTASHGLPVCFAIARPMRSRVAQDLLRLDRDVRRRATRAAERHGWIMKRVFGRHTPPVLGRAARKMCVPASYPAGADGRRPARCLKRMIVPWIASPDSTWPPGDGDQHA